MGSMTGTEHLQTGTGCRKTGMELLKTHMRNLNQPTPRQSLPVVTNPLQPQPKPQKPVFPDIFGIIGEKIGDILKPKQENNNTPYDCLSAPEEGYGVPQATAYEAPTQESNYEAPQAESYEAPQTDSYEAPQADSYEAPKADSYEAPQADSYEAPQADSY